MATLSLPRHRTGQPAGARALPHIAWFAAGALGAFAVPFVFTSLLDLQHDAYYGLYFVYVAALVAGYVLYARPPLPGPRATLISAAVGMVAAGFVVMNVLNGDETARPDGAYYAFELLWRGVIYGAVDAVLLSAFPVLVAFALLDRDLRGIARKAAFGGLALAMTLVITGAYHLGYEQYREDGIGGPELGNVIMSVPAIATVNPAGSIIAHASMHVAAVEHSYETDVYLPPQTDADE